MVQTRNQKRKIDESDGEHGSGGGNGGANDTGQTPPKNVGQTDPTSHHDTPSAIQLYKRRKQCPTKKENILITSSNSSPRSVDYSEYFPDQDSSLSKSDVECEASEASEVSDGNADSEVLGTNDGSIPSDEYETYESDDVEIRGSDDAAPHRPVTRSQTNPVTEKVADQQAQVLNMKFSKEQISEIIKTSVRQILKKYKEEDMEFFTGKQLAGSGASEDEETPYDKFTEYIESIYDGEFFERVPLEDRMKKLKNSFSERDIQSFNEQLENLKKSYRDNGPSIIEVLSLDVPLDQKKKLLEKFHHLANNPVLSEEHTRHLKTLESRIKEEKEVDPEEQALKELEAKILERCNGQTNSYKKKILTSSMSFENKVVAYEKLSIMEAYEDNDTSEHAKYKNWLDTLLSIPFGKYIDLEATMETAEPPEIQGYMRSLRQCLDEELSFLEKPKDQIMNIISHMIRNPSTPINALGIYGSPGTGKTSIVKSIAKALGRPYKMISLGGESDNSMLTGHGFTYVGSTPGRIIDILKETQCMNPVILIDELDKISNTNKGAEIIGTLIHLTDHTTNDKYNYDRYFAGIEFDLSKVLFIFTYNDPSQVDKILADRLVKINVDDYSQDQKYSIATKHIIPNVLKAFGFADNDITFSKETVYDVLNTCKKDEAGMRDTKRKVEFIVSRINTLLLTNPEDNLVHLPYKKLYENYKTLPVEVKPEHVKVFLSEFTNKNEEKFPFFMYS
jgi:ATP-dependent Lon protease